MHGTLALLIAAVSAAILVTVFGIVRHNPANRIRQFTRNHPGLLNPLPDREQLGAAAQQSSRLCVATGQPVCLLRLERQRLCDRVGIGFRRGGFGRTRVGFTATGQIADLIDGADRRVSQLVPRRM